MLIKYSMILTCICVLSVILPHIGSATVETRNEMASITAKNIIAVLEGIPKEMPAEYTSSLHS